MSIDLVQQSVRGKLRALQLALRVRLLGEAVAWLLLAVVAAVFVSLALDYALHLPVAPRIAVAVVVLAGVGYIVFRTLVLPMSVSMDTDNLALLVERRFANLGDRLISAIQFSRMPSLADDGASPAMIERMAHEANELADRCNFTEIVDRKGMWQMLGVAAMGVVILAGFGLWKSNILGLWFQRDVLFRDIPWPQDTYLVVECKTIVASGDDLPVSITVSPDSKVIPSSVIVHARDAEGTTLEEIKRSSDTSAAFEKVFHNVTRDFEFYVTGGDDELDKNRKHSVRVIPRPLLTGATFAVRHRDYVGRNPEVFDGARGAVVVRHGSTVDVIAETNKDIKSAALLIDGREVGGLKVESAKVASSPDREVPRLLKGSFEAPSPDAKGGRKGPGSWSLVFKLDDVDGLSSDRGARYLLQLQPDMVPTVEIKTHGVGPRITAIATIPMDINIKDDCGISGIEAGAQPKDKKLQSLPIKMPPDRRAEMRMTYDLEVEPLGLKPGDTVSVSLRATDNLPAEFGGPNVGRSGVASFTIVTPEELREELISRQMAVTVEFHNTRGTQNAATLKVGAALVALTDKITPEVRNYVTGASAVETTVAAEIGKAANILETILDEMKNNKLDIDQHANIQTIIDALGNQQKTATLYTGALNKAAGIKDVAALRDELKRIELNMRKFEADMEALESQMKQVASRQQIAAELKIIMDETQKLLDELKLMTETAE